VHLNAKRGYSSDTLQLGKRTLRRFNSIKMFFGFTLRALTKRSRQQRFYLYARDMKSG